MSKCIPLHSSNPRIQCLLLLLALIFIRTTKCHSIQCWSLPQGSQAPISSDCRRALAHLPSFYDHVYVISRADAENLMGSSRPFLPSGQILHGSCGIQFTAHNVTESGLHLEDPLPLTIPAIIQTWNRMEAGADSVMSQCVDHSLVGSANHFVDTHAYPGLAYNLLVFKPLTPGPSWSEELYRDLDQHIGSVHVDRSKKARYVV